MARHKQFFCRANPQSTEEFGRLIQSLSNSELYEIRGLDSINSRSARATLSIVRVTTPSGIRTHSWSAATCNLFGSENEGARVPSTLFARAVTCPAHSLSRFGGNGS